VNAGKAALLVVVGGIAAAAYANAMKEARGEDGCPTTGPDRNVVALLDGSDPTIDSQLEEISRALREVAQSLGSREKLWVFVFGGADEADLIPIPGACNRVGDADWLRGRIWEADQEKKFFEAIDRAVGELKESRKGNSPIVEGLDRLLFKSELFKGGGADLLIFSDMIQNTPLWSHFPSLPGYRPPSLLEFPSREGLPDRKWNSVRIYEVQRPRLRGLQSADSARWWVELLSMVSKTLPVIEKL
jgi:hypothetical protein